MGNLQGKYIFGVCTFGDHPGLTIESLCKTMRRNGGKLAAGFSVHMQYNYITPPDGLKNYFGCFTLREIALEKQLNLFAGEKEKVETISEFVNAHKTGIFETDTIFVNRLVEILNLEEFLGKSLWLKIAGITEITTLSFLESRQLMDHAFQADENCKRCGICSRLCLVANITMLGGRPNWQHHCEQCFACLQWCPAQALQFGSQTFGRKRYHHPDVVLAELMKH